MMQKSSELNKKDPFTFAKEYLNTPQVLKTVSTDGQAVAVPRLDEGKALATTVYNDFSTDFTKYVACNTDADRLYIYCYSYYSGVCRTPENWRFGDSATFCAEMNMATGQCITDIAFNSFIIEIVSFQSGVYTHVSAFDWDDDTNNVSGVVTSHIYNDDYTNDDYLTGVSPFVNYKIHTFSDEHCQTKTSPVENFLTYGGDKADHSLFQETYIIDLNSAKSEIKISETGSVKFPTANIMSSELSPDYGIAGVTVSYYRDPANAYTNYGYVTEFTQDGTCAPELFYGSKFFPIGACITGHNFCCPGNDLKITSCDSVEYFDTSDGTCGGSPYAVDLSSFTGAGGPFQVVSGNSECQYHGPKSLSSNYGSVKYTCHTGESSNDTESLSVSDKALISIAVFTGVFGFGLFVVMLMNYLKSPAASYTATGSKEIEIVEA
jgi:hypothetical protein